MPYRVPILPRDNSIELIEAASLGEHLAAIRAGVAAGAYATTPRSLVAEMALGIEAIHASAAPYVAAQTSRVTTGLAVCGALAALFARLLSGALGAAVPAVFILGIVYLGRTLAKLKEYEAVLARTRETYSDLMRLAEKLPVDKIPEHVRVDAEMVAGTVSQELAESPVTQERKAK